MKCWYWKGQLYLATILEGIDSTNCKLSIEVKKGSLVSEKNIHIKKGENLFVGQVAIPTTPEYILVTISPGDITYLVEPNVEPIPLCLAKASGFKGIGMHEVAHSLNGIYSSFLATVINEIVGMIHSVK